MIMSNKRDSKESMNTTLSSKEEEVRRFIPK